MKNLAHGTGRIKNMLGDTKRDCRYFSPKRGRFDLNMPNGTLNLASTPEAALRERLGPRLIGPYSASP